MPLQNVARDGRNKMITGLQSRRLGILILILSLRQSVNLDNLLPLSSVHLTGQGERFRADKKVKPDGKTPSRAYIPQLLNPEFCKEGSTTDLQIPKKLMQTSRDSFKMWPRNSDF